MRNGLMTLVDAATIAAAGTVTGISCPTEGIKALLVEAAFTYAADGTSVDVFIQTRVKGGTWRDIMQFAFTTSSLKKWSKVDIFAALTAAQVASDAALADDTILDGFLGDEVRAKYVVTGTYTGATALTVTGSAKY